MTKIMQKPPRQREREREKNVFWRSRSLGFLCFLFDGQNDISLEEAIKWNEGEFEF